MKEYRDTPKPTMTDEEMIRDYPRLAREYTLLHQDYREAIRKPLNMPDAVKSLPSKEEIISEGEKQIVDWLENNDEREKQAYRIGFRRSFEYVLRRLKK